MAALCMAMAVNQQAEAAMAKIGTEWEWLANGDVRTTSAVVPAIRTDKRTGRKMFFNNSLNINVVRKHMLNAHFPSYTFIQILEKNMF